MFSQNSRWFKNITFLSIFVLSAGLVWVGWSNFSSDQTGKTAKASFNATARRFEDTIDSTNTNAKYSYVFENTSPDAANGYFELKMEALSLTNIKDIVDVVSIKQTFPVNASTGELTNVTPTVINEVVSDASFISGQFLNVRISPGTQCVRITTGGCDTKIIPAAVPMRIDIELKRKPNLTSNYVLDGQGKVYFPNGFDANQIGWRIKVNPNNQFPPNFNPDLNRFENILDATNTTAKYSYIIENTAPDVTNGYFELKMQNLGLTNISEIVDVTSIKQTFPINATTGEPINNSPTIINENITKASFTSAEFLNVKISPGTECVPILTGGCEIKPIPAAVPMRLDVELKLKPNITNKYILDGQGKVYFPNGFDANQIGWRINVNPDAQQPSAPTATITQATLSTTGLSVAFSTNNYSNTPGGVHTHFYFDTEANTAVNKMYSGASPYVIPSASIPQNATKICAIVANADHTVIADSGNCVNFNNSTNPGGGNNNPRILPVPFSKVVAGMPQDFMFSVTNNGSSTSDIYTTIGLPQATWTQAKTTTIRPTPVCTLSPSDSFTSTGTCEDLFNAGGFKVNNLAPGASAKIKVSKVIFVAPPADTNNEISFSIFSSNTNAFGANTTPNVENVTYNSSYGNSLDIKQEKVTSAYAFGGADAFAQIQSPYNDLIYAVTVKNTAQVAYNGVAIETGLDSEATNYFNGCSFSQVQNLPVAQPGQVVINVVNSNLQGTGYTGANTNYTYTNITIPASNGYEPSKVVLYVGCRRNSSQIPNNTKLYANTRIINFDNSLDAVFDLIAQGGIKSKLQINSGNNLKIQKSLISKSTSKIKAGTEAEYEVRVQNIGPASSSDFYINDIIQIPSGVGINVNLSTIVNPFQDGSTTSRVVSSQDLDAAFPVTNNLLGNINRSFKVTKLKGNDLFSFRYKVTFYGTIPNSCTTQSQSDNFQVIRNIAFVSNVNSGISNGDAITGATNNLSLGSIADFLKFNTSIDDKSLNINSNILFDDTDFNDNLAIVDNTKDLCDQPNTNPVITSSTLTTNEIPNLNIDCLPVVSGTKTICSFKLAKEITLPNDFKIGVGDALPMVSCQRLDFNPEDQDKTNAIVSNIVVCKDVLTPAAGLSVLIFAQIGNQARTLTGEKLNPITDSTLPLTLTPTDTQVQIAWGSASGQPVLGIPEVSISLNEGDNLTSFETASFQVVDFTTIAITNLIPCSSYKIKFSLSDIAGNIISSKIKEFKTTGCVDNKPIKAEKTVPVSNSTGGKVKLVDGADSLDLNIPAGFSNGDKKIQAKKLDQTASQINGLPKLPKSKRLAKSKTFDLKAFDSTNSVTTTFQQPISVSMSYTDQDVSLLDPSSLTIKSWNGTAWEDLTNCTKDTVNKKVTCDTTHFSVFSLTGQSALDTSDLDWSFTPNSGTTAPLFKDSTPVVATVKNFSTSRNNTPIAGEYTCKFEFKPIKSSGATYTQISAGVAYDPVTGCSGNLTKALRANNLNIEFKITLTNVSNPNQNYTSTHKYFMLFRGSGVAFGN